MTNKEKKALKISGDLFNAFKKLPKGHPSDLPDVTFHIHAIQNIILSRKGLRSLRKKTSKKR